MQRFKSKGHDLGGYRCVSLPTGEKCLAGERGEIWEVAEGKGLYRGFSIAFGNSEKLFTCTIDGLRRALLKIRWKPEPEIQEYWANNPNKRLV